MGPWCADRAAVNLYHRIEKQKIKTPHERHYLLLCLVNTALLEIHAVCEQTFKKFTNHKELVENYSSPKVLRLLEILRLFKPPDHSSDHDQMKKLSSVLDNLNFQVLTRSLEHSCQSLVDNVAKQQIESRSIVDNLDALVKTDNISIKPQTHKTSVSNGTEQKTDTTCKPRRQFVSQSGRLKRRTTRRHKNENGDDICGLVYCDSNQSARVLFDLLSEMSRNDPMLKFLKCQFTTDRIADPITEPKEAEAEHRRQEEVLKRFRMHDCNILIGTSVLEVILFSFH